MSDSKAQQHSQALRPGATDRTGMEGNIDTAYFWHSFKGQSSGTTRLSGSDIRLELLDVSCRVHVTTDHDGPAEARHQVLSTECHLLDLCYPRDTALGRLSLTTEQGKIWAWSSDEPGPQFRCLEIRSGPTKERFDEDMLLAGAEDYFLQEAKREEEMRIEYQSLERRHLMCTSHESEVLTDPLTMYQAEDEQELAADQPNNAPSFTPSIKVGKIDVRDISLFCRNLHGATVKLQSSGRVLAELDFPEVKGCAVSPGQVGVVLSGAGESNSNGFGPLFLVSSVLGDVALATTEANGEAFRGSFMAESVHGMLFLSNKNCMNTCGAGGVMGHKQGNG